MIIPVILENSFEKIKNVVKVCTQVEGPGNIEAFIRDSKNLGYKTGLSISIETENKILDEYLDIIDFVQFMSVKLGSQGQVFAPSVINKIIDFKQKHPG